MSAKKLSNRYDYSGMSAFCLQASLLLDAGIPLSDGLSIMAEDASSEWERDMLQSLSRETSMGTTMGDALEQDGRWPNYIVKMCKVGQETGRLDTVLKSLSEYCDRLYRTRESIKRAVTYPLMLIIMLLVVLYVLFAHVMPIFRDVYEQMGAQLSPITVTTMNIGRIASSAALIILIVLLLIVVIVYLINKTGKKIKPVEMFMGGLKKHLAMSKAMYKSEFASVLAMTIQSGLPMEKGFELTEELIDDPEIKKTIRECTDRLSEGENYYDILKQSKLFSGFHIQMIQVGVKSGHLDTVMDVIAKDYEEKMTDSIDRMIGSFEPTVVAVLAICVGIVLLSVMIPLVGLLSSIG